MEGITESLTEVRPVRALASGKFDLIIQFVGRDVRRPSHILKGGHNEKVMHPYFVVVLSVRA